MRAPSWRGTPRGCPFWVCCNMLKDCMHIHMYLYLWQMYVFNVLTANYLSII